VSGRDQDTDPDTPAVNVPDGVVGGESRPPDEHTMRVRARNQVKTSLKVHDAPEPPPDPPAARSSSEMAESSRRQIRRERDRRAEKRAMQMVVVVFLGLGGGAILLVNALVDDPVPSETPPTDPSKVAVAPPPPPKGVISSGLDETPNIPALQHLADSGLTIAAEGIPQVDAVEGAAGVAALAAIETCRFAYAVWEFSPNKRFRFLSTCDALEGQVMFGAYEVDGATIRMSPLISDTDVVVSEFFMVQPSKMVSRVSRSKGGETILQIEQKVTAMRPGQDGEAWRDAFSAKNTIHLPKGGGSAPPPPTSAPPPPPAKKEKSGDPLLDLLKNG
jgi:hypothetical protein